MIGSHSNVHLRDDYVAGGQVSAREMNKIASALNGMRGEGGISVRMDVGGLVISGAAAVEDGINRPFHPVEINDVDGTVRTHRGVIIHGQNLLVVGEREIAVSGGTEGNPVFAVLRYTFGSGSSSAEVLDTTVGNMPTPTANAWVMPLWSAYKVDGRIKIAEILWDSILIIPSVWQ